MTTTSQPKWKNFAAAAISGIIIGCVAYAVKHTIALVSRLATSGFQADHYNWWLIPLALASICISSFITRKIVRLPLNRSSIRLKSDLTRGITPLPRRLMVAPVAVNALTLGLGGSAGAEGPIAYTGAAIASRVAQRLHLTHEQTLAFLACGAGAGIAAIFKAPMGGVFYTLEVLAFSMTSTNVITLVVMCLFAGLTAYATGGFLIDMAFLNAQPFDLKWYLPAIILGLICGIYSLYYNWCAEKTINLFNKFGAEWKRNIVGGLSVGICLFIFPALYGEGFGVLGKVLNGNTLPLLNGSPLKGFGVVALLTGIVLIKSFATYATKAGGGVAGEFAPTVFAGGMLGALFALLAVNVPGWETIPMGNFIILAMAAVMAGTIKTPLMAIFIIIEMTEASPLLLPVSIAAGLSYLISNFRNITRPMT